MDIRIRTPGWTGNIGRESKEIQIAGIIGSLRWWMEAILRSLGKKACDPTGNNRCPVEEKSSANKKFYCHSCAIFGATGLRRPFKLDIDGGEPVFEGGAINIRPDGRRRGWHLGSGLKGTFNLKITALNKDFDEAIVYVPLILASRWGGIGAKTQLGYGVVEFEYPEVRIESFENIVARISKNKNLIRQDNFQDQTYPDLKHFFFAKVLFKVIDKNWWKKVAGIKGTGEKEIGIMSVMPMIGE